MAIPITNVEFNGLTSSWRIRQEFMTMSYSVTVTVRVTESQIVLLNSANDIKESFYAGTVEQLAKALGELKGQLLGTQNP